MGSTPQLPAIIYHDTHVILDVDDGFCDLFHSDRATLIGLELTGLIWSEDFQGLLRLRMRVLREQGQVPPVLYLFHRFDGSRFYGRVVTEKIDDGQYRSAIEFERNI
jgi:PAS domain S-box-containing protein